MQMPSTASFNGFDWFLVAVIAVSTIAAFLRGIIKVLFSLGGLILGIIFASWNYLTLAARLQRLIPSFAIAEVVAFLLILAIIMVLFSLAAGLVRKTVSAVGLGIVDRLLGALFGILRGSLLGVAAMMAIAAFMPDSPWIKNSQLAPYFLAAAHAVSFVVPEHFQHQITDGATRLLQQTPDLLRPHTLTQPTH